MPKEQTILSVFISSPDDVLAERDCIKEVIDELNVTWNRTLQLRLELISWETSTYPGIGEDSQAVIDEQIDEDYDIFVGIMWARFGTPTKRSGSGTEEEFNKALKKWKENPNQIKIFFYFKEAPIDPYKIELEQLSSVKTFRERLKKEGVLFRTFNDTDEFNQLIRMHLSIVVQEWGIKWGDIKEESGKIKIATPISKIKEDQGLIDLLELGEKKYKALYDITNDIVKEMQSLSTKLNSRTQEINKEKSRSDFNLQRYKRFINLAAADMEQFSDALEKNIQEFDELYTEGANAFIQSINLLKDFKPEKDEANKSLNQIKELELSLNELKIQLKGLYGIIKSTPPITTVYNRAKRRVLSVLEEFNDKISKSILLTKDLEKALKEYIVRGLT